jgi:hypothetical protein
MKYYAFKQNKHTDAEYYKKCIYPSLHQYIKSYINNFNERNTGKAERRNSGNDAKTITGQPSIFSTAKYMEMTTRVMQLLRNMVYHGVWDLGT